MCQMVIGSCPGFPNVKISEAFRPAGSMDGFSDMVTDHAPATLGTENARVPRTKVVASVAITAREPGIRDATPLCDYLSLTNLVGTVLSGVRGGEAPATGTTLSSVQSARV